MITMTPEIKEMLLDLHNNFRSTIAEGKQEPYEPATRMATMVFNMCFPNTFVTKRTYLIIFLYF